MQETNFIEFINKAVAAGDTIAVFGLVVLILGIAGTIFCTFHKFEQDKKY